jgi:hypothetical protein
MSSAAKIGDEHSYGKKFHSANEEFQHVPDRQLGAMYYMGCPRNLTISPSLQKQKRKKIKMIG